MSIETFITRWQNADGNELANSQLFLSELCELLELPKPEPASADTEQNAYVFERRVDILRPDGCVKRGRIDLYRRGCFVLESKKTKHALDSGAWDKAMQRAHAQADAYIRALPADEGRPPFLLVVDVGRSIEIYSEFSRSGATYIAFPDPQSFRIKLTDLRREEIRQRLRQIWLDPLNLDPSRHAARVTREIATCLAEIAKSLEAENHSAEQVSGFLSRCLFSMFAEDVGLLPKRSFSELLDSLQNTPTVFAPMLESLWQVMDEGGFSPHLRLALLRFNGGLFKNPRALPLDTTQIHLLLQAARADWSQVEPAIFGTLLERALNPRERHKLGAHYTPRAYVERLVLPTIIEALRAEWRDVKIAAAMVGDDKKQAVELVRDFHRKLCALRILDPACGSGNFLYVTLEHMKRLEGDILNTLHDLGESQGLLEMQHVTVSPQQFFGLEINPRAASIAEMVLWIGYLQWHFRAHGKVNPPEPVLRDFHNIECRDALIAYDGTEEMRDEHGESLTRWDGRTTKTHPITGKEVPDESARVAVVKYLNPRQAEWPQADFIVGNPPFIGAGPMRAALGDGYVDAVRHTWRDVPESADFVMYWWHKAALTVRSGAAHAFGFITTNSLKQTFNRRVVQYHLENSSHGGTKAQSKNLRASVPPHEPLSLTFAIPDHPWVDATDGAAVRIAMSVGRSGEHVGTLVHVIKETSGDSDDFKVVLKRHEGILNADLTIGANVAAACDLIANSDLCSRGVQLIGSGFMVTRKEAQALGWGRDPALDKHIREYRNGRDLTQTPRGVMVIDLFGLEIEEVKKRFPAVYQWLLDRVKPEREHNNRASYQKTWWIFGEARREWRRMAAGIRRYISTVETSKHRFFTFLDKTILPDNMLVNIALEDAFYLGVLSSRIHVEWVHRKGGTLGPAARYNKTVCCETFPFPDCDELKRTKINDLAEQLDAFRKQRQQENPDLTLTGMYNVLEKIRSGTTLDAKDKETYQQGVISMLQELHDDLDDAVFSAYGWDDLKLNLIGRPGATTPLSDKPDAQAEAEEELLRRLVELNAQRATEEAQGHIRWLRPAFQNPQAQAATTAQQTSLIAEQAASVPEPTVKQSWPKDMQAQIQAVRKTLAICPMDAASVAAHFKRKPIKGVSQVLAALESLGMVEQDKAGRFELR
jgi:hypothetical protein